jgi:hypothetical protein
MSTKIQGWRAYPNYMRDEELVRNVLADPESSPLERNMALRLEKLCYKCDDLEMDVANAKCESAKWVQLELFPS